MSIGKRIKKLRTQQGMSIDELADKLGKNRTTVYRYENGNIENLPLCILDSLATSLNTTPAYLMGWSDDYRVTETSSPPVEMSYLIKWVEEYGLDTLTDEECQKIIEYARFIVSQRDN